MPGVTKNRAALSVLVDLEGWLEDTGRFLAALERHPAALTTEIVVADRTGGGAAGLAPAGTVVDLPAGTGYGAARNAALRRATGDVVVLVDTSVEPTGDVLTPLAEALADPSVAVAGPFGLVTDNLYDYSEQLAGEVAAVSGYCLAARRADLLAVGGVRETFAWYRNADIDLSFQVRAAGFEARVVPLPVTKHEHRGWAALDEVERDRRSRKNHAAFLSRWRDRQDLIS